MSSSASAVTATSSASGVNTPTSSAVSISGSTLQSPSILTPSISTMSIADTDITAMDPTASSDIQISTLTTSLENSDQRARTLISITPPASSTKQPVTLVCVIDVSGSMSTVARIKTNENGVETTESDGLSILDVVKHAMRTIIASLGDKDRLGIVSFSDTAEVKLEIMQMTDSGKKKAGDVVENLHTKGMTNLWDGLKTGLSLFQKERASIANSVASVFVLTDGLPNVEPPRGSVAMLKSTFDRDVDIRGVSVNTFGFGYDLDSQILLELAEVGQGNFIFIPDAGMVGTGFINTLSNTFVTMAVNAVLSVELEDGVELVSAGKRLRTVKGEALPGVVEEGEQDGEEWLLGGHECVKTSWGIQITLGSIQYGQSRDVVLDLTGAGLKSGAPLMNLKLTCEICTPQKTPKTVELTNVTYPSQPSSEDAERLISYHHSRALTVSALKTILRSPSNSRFSQGSLDLFPEFDSYLTTTAINPIQNSVSASSSTTKALLADLTGQFCIAISKQPFYNRWGRHYFRSISRSHLIQQCSNFKDPGVQVYGGSTFRSLREKLDVIFDSLPPPKPSFPTSSSRGRGSSSFVSMARYNMASAPCFAGDGLVQLADGSKKRVQDIRKGDKLAAFSEQGGSSRTVRCVLVTRIASGEIDLVSLDNGHDDVESPGLKITPYHPVFNTVSTRWSFPVDISPAKKLACDKVYSFLLEKQGNDIPENHTLMINGIACVTFGCGITEKTEDDARGHPFLSDYSKVVQALKEVDKEGFEIGWVECAGVKREKGGRTGEELVCGFEKVGELREGWNRYDVGKEQVNIIERALDEKNVQPQLVPIGCY